MLQRIKLMSVSHALWSIANITDIQLTVITN